MRVLQFFASALIPLLFIGLAYGQQSDRDQGIELYRSGQFSDAASMLDKAVAADAGDRVAWIFLGGSYVHLNEEGKAQNAFRKSYTKPTTAPPKYDKSVKVTYKPHAGYSEEARRHLSSGTVTIAVEFQADGTIGFVFPLQTTVDPELVQQSINAAKGIKFEPAEKNGKAVTVINIVMYSFLVR